uniref:Uncharacterized protein n=1 Tax=Setaria digitata TaxID=48799 RepID=A0A915PRL2_9BILA
MAEIENDELVQMNGVDTEEIKTKIDAAPNDEVQPTENPQDNAVDSITSEVVNDEARSAELNGVEGTGLELPEAEVDGLPAQTDGDELNAVEAMEQVVERVEAEVEFEGGEKPILSHRAEFEQEEPAQMMKEAVEEQVVEDRTEDQVPDITGTDNADVMATSMDSIEELPTSEEQGVEAAELPVKLKGEDAFMAAKVSSQGELETVTVEDEASQKLDEAEAVATEEATAVSAEASQKDCEAAEMPVEQEQLYAPEAKSEELEEVQETEEAQSEAGQAQEQYMGPVEVVGTIQEIVTQQEMATDASQAVAEETSEVGEEATKEDEYEDAERNEFDGVESLNEDEQFEVNETAQMKEEESSFISAPQPEEKSEANKSDRATYRQVYEANHELMETLPRTNEEFAFDEEKPLAKKFITEEKISLWSNTEEKFPPHENPEIEEKIPSKKVSASEQKVPSRKTSAVEDEKLQSKKISEVKEKKLPSRQSSRVQEEKAPSRKASEMDEKAVSRKTSVAEDEKPQSRKVSEIKEKRMPSRQSSVVKEEKAPSRKTSEMEEKAASRKTSAVENETVVSRKSSAVLSRKISVEMEDKAPSRKTSKMTNPEEAHEELSEFSQELSRAARSTGAGKTNLAKTASGDEEAESEPESVAEPLPSAKENISGEEVETVIEIPDEHKEEVFLQKDSTEDLENEVKQIPATETEKENEKSTAGERQESPPTERQFFSSPSPIRKRRERSLSPSRREVTHESAYKSYDQDSYRQRGPPPRMPSYLSFSSHMPVEKAMYTPVSPWIQNATQKYRNEYTAVSNYRPPSTYTSIFDDIVTSGPFSSSLYSTSRLLERSRSRSRELRNALRSRRSSSNYYRYTSNYATPPLRTRDYSTPPLSSAYHPSSRSGSFISFMEYSGQKQYELVRSSSRFSALDGLSRTSSRSNFDMFYDNERLSRVENYVRDLNRHVEHEFPGTYAKYRSSSRPYLTQEYTPINGYRVHDNPLSLERYSIRHTNPYIYNPISVPRILYESRIVDLERSLSRERLARERMKAKYKSLSQKLEQACKQMDLLRTNSYSSIRGGTGTYSVYTHNYPLIRQQIRQAVVHLAVSIPVSLVTGQWVHEKLFIALPNDELIMLL